MSERTSWVAVCAYPGKDQFRFFSPAFVSAGWSSLDDEAREAVRDAWAKISPHDPPEIIDLIPGYLEYVKVAK